VVVDEVDVVVVDVVVWLVVTEVSVEVVVVVVKEQAIEKVVNNRIIPTSNFFMVYDPSCKYVQYRVVREFLGKVTVKV